MFTDLKVIELASVLAGPTVGTFFSELGAQVLKIENPLGGGDVTRHWKLENEDPEAGVSAYYAAANFQKTVLSLNLKAESDLQKLYSEVETADVLICNLKSGHDKKLKVDYESLKKINPRLIYGQITGFGPENKRTAYDVVLQAESGFMSMNGTPESGPVKMPVALIDILTAHQLKEGILCALWQRQKTQKGTKVHVSLYDAALSSLANQATNYLMGGHIPKPMGSLHPNIAPYGEMFHTADGAQIVLAFGNDRQFVRFCDLLGLATILDTPDFQTNKERVKNRKELAAHFAPAIRQLTSATIKKWITEFDLPIGFVKDLEAVFSEEKAQSLILEEVQENVATKRVKTVVFELKD